MSASGHVPIPCCATLKIEYPASGDNPDEKQLQEWLQELDLQPRSITIPPSISKRNGKKQATTRESKIAAFVVFASKAVAEAAFKRLNDLLCDQHKANLLLSRLKTAWMKVNWPDCKQCGRRKVPISLDPCLPPGDVQPAPAASTDAVAAILEQLRSVVSKLPDASLQCDWTAETQAELQRELEEVINHFELAGNIRGRFKFRSMLTWGRILAMLQGCELFQSELSMISRELSLRLGIYEPRVLVISPSQLQGFPKIKFEIDAIQSCMGQSNCHVAHRLHHAEMLVMEFNFDMIHVIGHQADEQLQVSDDGDVSPEVFCRVFSSLPPRSDVMPSIFLNFCESECEGKALWHQQLFSCIIFHEMAVYDKDAAQIAQDFYGHLRKKGGTQVSSLQEAFLQVQGEGAEGLGMLPDPTPVSKILDSHKSVGPGRVLCRMALLCICVVVVRLLWDRESALEGCPKHLGSGICFDLLPQKESIVDLSADFLLQDFGVHAVDAKALMTATQEKWLRPKGLQRWEWTAQLAPRGTMESSEQYFRKLGFMDPILPPIRAERYKHVLILGATLAAVKRRIEFLGDLSLGNWSFESVVMMGSTRALNHDSETVEGFQSVCGDSKKCRRNISQPSYMLNCTDEACMMQLLWENMNLTPALRDLPCTFVRGRPIGETKRAPALKDTVLTWLETEPFRGSILAISTQPHVQTQHYNLMLQLQGWDLTTVGPGTSSAFWNKSSSQFYDAAARLIFALSRFLAK
ncbi:unnamed protein product [Symbiodinium sp. CCMP2592]|nr:unnamed protein product [Symbiodinium sp. CCMP2592]